MKYKNAIFSTTKKDMNTWFCSAEKYCFKVFQSKGEWFLSRSSPSIFDFSKNHFAQFFCLAFAKFRILHLSSITQKVQHRWGWMRDDDMKIIFSKNIDSQLASARSLTFSAQMLAAHGQFEVTIKSCIFLKRWHFLKNDLSQK